jgi:hypothetical protein
MEFIAIRGEEHFRVLSYPALTTVYTVPVQLDEVGEIINLSAEGYLAFSDSFTVFAYNTMGKLILGDSSIRSVISIGFSPYSSNLFVVGTRNRMVVVGVFDLSTGDELRVVGIDCRLMIEQCTFTADCSRLVMGSPSLVSVFDTQTGELVRRIPVNEKANTISLLRMSPVGDFVYRTYDRRRLVITNTVAGENRTVDGFEDVFDVSPDGSALIVHRRSQTGEPRHSVIVDSNTLDDLTELSLNTHSAKFLPDGNVIVVNMGGWNRFFVINPESGGIVNSFETGLQIVKIIVPVRPPVVVLL